ncbi:hypothetical protein [Engelhardtia mirabilis]|uniref:Uncharacterized protein n=1 Tax=Engelhardtia mirabilis TaxID=2528011 RepID=A0A518BKR5_9BACT|nr:hypothetical protein Pla133_26530 [Planctomycetes bacterium Pla133]QDV01891.1 hypothetical protein Pla86_26520 [Planctomycetes bacterium Pla86]
MSGADSKQPSDLERAERLQDWLERGRVEFPGDGADRGLRDTVMEARRLAAEEYDASVLASRRVAVRVIEQTVGGMPFHMRVRRALKRSVALRVVAASVLVHLLALPAVAWYVIAPQTMPDFVLSFLPVDRDDPAGVGSPLELPDDEAAEALAERRGEVENRLRIDRFRIGTAALPDPIDVAGLVDSARPKSAADWIALRIELRRGVGHLPAAALTADLSDPLTSLAVLETCLDALALDPESELSRRSADRARLRVAALSAVELPWRELAPAALERAASYGVGPAGRSPSGVGASGGEARGLDLGWWLRGASAGLENLAASEPWASWLVWADGQR